MLYRIFILRGGGAAVQRKKWGTKRSVKCWCTGISVQSIFLLLTTIFLLLFPFSHNTLIPLRSSTLPSQSFFCPAGPLLVFSPRLLLHLPSTRHPLLPPLSRSLLFIATSILFPISQPLLFLLLLNPCSFRHYFSASLFLSLSSLVQFNSLFL